MVVYGCRISYFTGKFETYLRYKQLPYRYRAATMWHYRWTIPRKLGATQVPSVELADGRWMSDTTPMIEWLERHHPDHPVIPADPAQGYLALLIEDFADEWLWRPAMHYRWSFQPDRYVAGTRLAEELLTIPAPLFERRRWVTRRQIKLFTAGDGIDEHTRSHADRAYTRVLEILEPVFRGRPFLFGGRPTIADIGLMGPFWRHFAHDPTPAAIMRERAPATHEWTARMWNARASELGDRPLLDGVPADLSPLFREVGETHLEALCANAQAHRFGARKHDLTVQGCTYRRVPTSAYRVWCLEQLRAKFERLPADAATTVREVLEAHGCWEPLWRVEDIDSGHDPAGLAPFCQTTRMVRD
jgi:glutathione S-transferase